MINKRLQQLVEQVYTEREVSTRSGSVWLSARFLNESGILVEKGLMNKLAKGAAAVGLGASILAGSGLQKPTATNQKSLTPVSTYQTINTNKEEKNNGKIEKLVASPQTSNTGVKPDVSKDEARSIPGRVPEPHTADTLRRLQIDKEYKDALRSALGDTKALSIKHPFAWNQDSSQMVKYRNGRPELKYLPSSEKIPSLDVDDVRYKIPDLSINITPEMIESNPALKAAIQKIKAEYGEND
jgi:hypothetical protein